MTRDTQGNRRAQKRSRGTCPRPKSMRKFDAACLYFYFSGDARPDDSSLVQGDVLSGPHPGIECFGLGDLLCSGRRTY